MLDHLASAGPKSRADLARALGVTRATAGNVVARLLAAGLLHHPPPAETGAGRAVGRPGELVTLNPDHCHVIGVDAGIGFILALRMNLCGDVIASVRVQLPTSSPSPATMARHLIALVDRIATGGPKIAGVSVAIPGIITRDGFVMRAPFLHWRNVAFRDLIAEAMAPHGALSLENDANALAMGEVIRNRVRPTDTNIFITMDVGVGGSIVRNGQLMDGQSGLAGEFGHIFVHPASGGDAVRLEDYTGRHAILRRHRELGGTARDLDAFLVSYDAGGGAARQASAEWIEVMAQALSTITSILNPGSIVFGGSMTAFMARVMAELEAAYDALLMHGTVKPHLILADSAEHSVARGCADLRRAAVFRAGRAPDER